jgi:uncharacterized protein (TIGR03089 family)
VLLGCWSAGLSVATATDAGPDADVVFAAVAAVSAAPPAGERFALGLAPLGAPLRELPAGFADYVAEVRGHGDRFTPYRRIAPADTARHWPAAMTHGELCAAARDRAAALGIGSGGRALVDAAVHEEPLDWLLAPLAAGASIVLCARLDPAAVADRVETERVTAVLTGSPG